MTDKEIDLNVRKYYHMAFYLAKNSNVYLREEDVEDLAQDLLMHLLYVLRSFDPSKGIPLGAFVATCLKRRRGQLLSSESRFKENHLSLEDPATEHETIGDIVSDELNRSPQDSAIARIVWDESMARLTPKQAAVLNLRLSGFTLIEVGVKLGVTRERIRQVQCAACQRLRIEA